jgi:TolB-like protein/cytochrome c-type biogenesis protein CcmH/NrfG
VAAGSLIAELRRRNVFRVAGGYLVVGWILMQVADTFFPALNLPDWTTTLVAALLVLGFPIAVLLAWAFELTPEGLKRDTGEGEAAPRGVKAADVVLIGLLVGVIGFMAFDRLGGDAPAPAARAVPGKLDPSVAVLPFSNMSADPDNEYFSDGLTDTLLHMLAQVKDLKVAARTSSFAFKGTNTDIREIARQLGVAAVLEGSVQRAGDRVRIVAQLIKADDGFHLWSQTYDRKLDDIFAVQDEIATSVAAAMRGSLLGEADVPAMDDGLTSNREAYDLFLRAREGLRLGTERRVVEAERQLRKALALDPEFALAWSALAQALESLVTVQGLSWADVRDEILAAAARGVELAPDVAETHTAQGAVLFWNLDLADAEAALGRALALDPDYAWALSGLADVEFRQGHYAEAVQMAERALAADPLDYELKAQSTFKFLMVGQVGQAIELAEAVLAHTPDSLKGLSALGNVYWRTGREAKAIPIYMRLLRINPNQRYIMERIARSYVALVDMEEARRWIDRAYGNNPDAVSDELAEWCFLSGDVECAIDQAENRLAGQGFPGELARLGAEADLAWYRQDWQRLLEVAQQQAKVAAEERVPIAVSWASLSGALAADRLGDVAARDRISQRAIDIVQEGIARGDRTQYGVQGLAHAYAIRGDAETAVGYLRTAAERGFRNVIEIRNMGVYDKIMDDPALAALLAQIEADNQRELEAVRAAVAALEATG